MTKEQLDQIFNALYTGYEHFQPQHSKDNYNRRNQNAFKEAIEVLVSEYPDKNTKYLMSLH